MRYIARTEVDGHIVDVPVDTSRNVSLVPSIAMNMVRLKMPDATAEPTGAVIPVSNSGQWNGVQQTWYELTRPRGPVECTTQ